VAHPSRRPRWALAPQDEVEFVARSRFQTANAPFRHSGARRWARARNPYARWWLWIPGPLAVRSRPGMTTRQASSARVLVRRRVCLYSSSLPHTEGAERRKTHLQNSARRAASVATLVSAGGVRHRHCWRTRPKRTRLTALHCDGFCPRHRFRARPDRACAHPAAFAAFVRPSRPTMAAPRNRGGRSSEASRGWLARHIRRRRTSRRRVYPVPAQLSCSINKTPHDDAPGRAR
jgi:hypothetical protein